MSSASTQISSRAPDGYDLNGFHCHGWAHFTQSGEDLAHLTRAFRRMTVLENLYVPALALRPEKRRCAS
jgi:hypothetical protein